MLEGYLASAITTHFGHLVEDADKISLSAWSGELVLRDLSLRRHALDHFLPDCPVEIAYGRIGNLEIRIPWKLIRSQLWTSDSKQTSCSVILTDVNVLLTPRRRLTSSLGDEDDSESDSQKCQDGSDLMVQIEEAVENALDKKLLQKVVTAEGPSLPDKQGWLQTRIAAIISNMSVTVRNIHIRYEDPGNSMGFEWDLVSASVPHQYRPPFAIGVLLKEFSLQTESPKEESGSEFHQKKAIAQDVASYWNTNCILASNRGVFLRGGNDMNDRNYFEAAFALLANGRLPATFPSSIPSAFQTRHSFVLDPFSPVVRFSLQKRADGEPPKEPSSIDATLPPCHISISRDLLEDVSYLRKSVAVWANTRRGILTRRNLRRLARLRPSLSPIAAPRQWWRYAFEGVLVFERIGTDARSLHIMKTRSRGWTGLVQALRNRRRYTALYQAFLGAETYNDRQRMHNLLQDFEKELLVDEIAAFRVYVCSHFHAVDVVGDKHAPLLTGDSPLLSVSHRLRTFIEMAEFLHREDIVLREGETKGKAHQVDPTDINESLSAGGVSWTTSLTCSEFSVRINGTGRTASKLSPIVRLSCAFFQDQRLYRDGSWEMTNRVGDLVVRDYTCLDGQNSVFSDIIGPKQGHDQHALEFDLDGVMRQQSVLLRVSRLFRVHASSGEIGSTTTTSVRVLPLEVVFISKPVEALARLFSAVNVEFSDDYHRISSKLSAWKEHQQHRLLRALAHRRKTILIDIDAGAPVLLFPEDNQREGLLLAVDLGRIKCMNADASPGQTQFDDNWRLELDNLQMFSCKVTHYQDMLPQNTLRRTRQNLIEPFSLTFLISTALSSEDEKGQSLMHVVATLPRLAFNITSSTARLVRRLQLQWQEHKRIIRQAKTRVGVLGGPRGHLAPHVSQRKEQTTGRSRKVEFRFVAPLVRVRLENDVDGRDCTRDSSSTPLFDLALRGMECSLLSEKTASRSQLVCSAKVGTLVMTDLYQHAGDDFTLLLSSVSPHLVASVFDARQGSDMQLTGTDLVSFDFTSTRDSKKCTPEAREGLVDKFTASFHELYVEWNPETIAAVFQAVKLPLRKDICVSHTETVISSEPSSSAESDNFFDAEEDNFFDAESVVSTESGDSRLISEISSSVMSSRADLRLVDNAETRQYPEWQTLDSPDLPFSRSPEFLSSLWPGMIVQSPKRPPSAELEHTQLTLVFEMSKLCVNFNKESRHRRVVTAEMDKTHVEYSRIRKGFSKVHAVIGNLTLSDPSSAEDATLYREIMGLQTDAFAGKPTSLLELEFTSKPKLRSFTHSMDSLISETTDDSVLINLARGSIVGYDNKIDAQLSPMRFVYLQQLWMEIVDYFFEGILGYEVWGSERPQPPDIKELVLEAPEEIVKNVPFTLFDVTMDKPVIIVPVACCSTDFLRLEAKCMSVGNRYSRSCMRFNGRNPATGEKLMQWFNNCKVTIDTMKVVNCEGMKLSSGKFPLQGNVVLSWPTGATAGLNVPKWFVRGSFHKLSLSLRREDVSVLKNIVNYNLGGESKNMDEWCSLQRLTPEKLEGYLRTILVHFGYDKKDVTPATFDVEIAFPEMIFNFETSEENVIGSAQFRPIRWSYEKYSDLVSRQKVISNIEMSSALHSQSPILYRSNVEDSGARSSMLKYSSTTQPTGDNTKTIEIFNPRIHAVIPAWRGISSFFQGLPGPTFLSPNEVIQIGDRWYRIGKSEKTSSKKKMMMRSVIDWIPGVAESTSRIEKRVGPLDAVFRLSLHLPDACIVIGNEESSVLLSLKAFEFSHHGESNQIRRKVDLGGIELEAKTSDNQGSKTFSLMQPWSVSAAIERCNGQEQCSCEFHSARVSTGTFRARVAYSDMLICTRVFLAIASDLETAREEDVEARQSTPCPETYSTDHGIPGDLPSTYPERTLARRFQVVADGLFIEVVDDSGRHFAGAQQLMVITSETIDFRTEETVQLSNDSGRSDDVTNETSTHLRLHCLEVIDSLQSRTSPFRKVLVIKPVDPVSAGEAIPRDGNTLGSNAAGVEENKSARHGFEFLRLVNTTSYYSIILGDVYIQYNPSMIIAVQRLLGRLTKCFNEQKKHTRIEERQSSNVERNTASSSISVPQSSQGALEIGSLSVSLNKEHQGRCLIKTVISRCQLRMEKTTGGSWLNGFVYSVDSFAPHRFGRERQSIVKSSSKTSRFVDFQYRTFSKNSRENPGDRKPEWLLPHLRGTEGTIDDYLEVSVSSIEGFLHREYTEELIDYLSNGFPGRGMGATSRAAKGFVTQRIQKKSFLHVSVEAPQICIPENDVSPNSVVLQLGDLKLQSWIEHASDGSESCRRVATSLTGLECGVFNGQSTAGKIVQRIDITVEAEKKLSCVFVRTKVSDVKISLSYVDYVAVVNVLRGNLTKKIDKDAWDNLEAKLSPPSFWEEESPGTSIPAEEVARFSEDIAYASSARHVRYGQAKLVGSKSARYRSCFRLSLGRLSLVLRRNGDPFHNVLEYDMLFVQGQGLEASAETSSDGDMSLSLSLREIFVFDLGESGRSISSKTKPSRVSSRQVSVIVEGYAPAEKCLNVGDLTDSFLVELDRDAGSAETKVAIILSCLSIAAMQQSLQETVAFLSCTWPCTTKVSKGTGVPLEDDSRLAGVPSDPNKSAETSLRFRFVLHYPRFIFVADELDPNSRALVLRGLAIANASRQTVPAAVSSDDDTSIEMDQAAVIKLNADFQNISSYINPDVSAYISPRLIHLSILGDRFSRQDLHGPTGQPGNDESTEDLNVPLLLPVTMGIEFEQKNLMDATLRSISVNIEPLSILLGGEDLQLVKSVVQKWSSSAKKEIPKAHSNFYDAVFRSELLGLGLRKDGFDVFVDSVREPAISNGVCVGDAIHAVNDRILAECADKTLSAIVDQLATADRPLKVTFARFGDYKQMSEDPDTGKLKKDIQVNGDLTFTSAVLTLVEKDFPLARGEVSNAKLKCGFSQSMDTNLTLSLTALIAVKCYNLGIWRWEPLLEQGQIAFHAEYEDPDNQSRQLTLEFGDSQGGLAVNITDAAAETASKVFEWGRDSPEDKEDLEVELSDLAENQENKISISRNAANAALVYARRQRFGTARPFVFRNCTGLSVAFVQQGVGERDISLAASPFLAVGGYSGLDQYDSRQITELANGAEIKFRVNVADDLQGEHSSYRTFPSLAVSLQTIGGVDIEPLTDLQIHRPGEVLLPLHCSRSSVNPKSTRREPFEGKHSACWIVEQIDEKTVMTLGSSVRILSLLRQPLEIGIGVFDSDESYTVDLTSCTMKNIGTAYPGQPFFLPLWLAMQGNAWCCGFKFDSHHRFSPLFCYSDGSSFDFGPLSGGTVGCLPRKGTLPSIWLSTAVAEQDGILTLTLDSLFSLRNLMPTDVEWEVTDRSLTPIDGSSLRTNDSFGSCLCALQSGEKVEILARSVDGVVGRFRPHGVSWSSWVSLCFIAEDTHAGDMHKQEAKGELSSMRNDLNRVHYAQAVDSFGVKQDIGVRLSRKDCGFEATLFVELWCANCSSLDLTFGYPPEFEGNLMGAHSEPGAVLELSPAEAALKEISSLFESGPERKGNEMKSRPFDMVRLPCQISACITEECFEYVDNSNGTRSRFWASENQCFATRDPGSMDSGDAEKGWRWIDPGWVLDRTGHVSEEGWESSASPGKFSSPRSYNTNHGFRRRRFFRKRTGLQRGQLVDSVHAYYQPRRSPILQENGNEPHKLNAVIGVQVNGGQWAVSSTIPREGSVYGAIRARSSRWPETTTAIYELCYSISPLSGPWGDVSKFMIVTSRFLLRNDSKHYVFEVKQAGSSDSTAIRLKPGESIPFHWADCRRPELISVRPANEENATSGYKWSGGFDPLTIGTLPLQIKMTNNSDQKVGRHIRSIKLEAEIRPKSGGTGINLSFEEESPDGDGALFRIENRSTFPVWISQDGMIANPSTSLKASSEVDGVLIRPAEKSSFGLEVPFRQGKYSNRKAATMDELLRLRLALSPLTSRAGIETTKVISLGRIGSRVRLNPSKLMTLEPATREELGRVRVLGIVENDGPTTVLTLRLMEKDSDNLLVNPFSDQSSTLVGDVDHGKSSSASLAVIRSAMETTKIRSERRLPTEDTLCSRSLFQKTEPEETDVNFTLSTDRLEKDLQISLRISFRGFVLSFVDSAPSEIAVVTLRNMNAIASWNSRRTTDATVFVTVTDLQVDNMIPNAPFPVAVSTEGMDEIRAPGKEPESAVQEDIAPVLVIGLSFAPRHKTGTVCLKSVTVAPRNLAVRVDLAFLVRLQKFVVDLQSYFRRLRHISDDKWPLPDLSSRVEIIQEAAVSGLGHQKFFFGGLTILPCNIKLSVAPARALNAPQAILEGKENAALHQAVRKGDVRLDRGSAAVLGVNVGGRNKTALAVVRGMFKSFVVDALLRLDGASINLSGVSLRNYVTTSDQLTTHLGAHYLASLRLNVPALLGSLAVIGNPIGLVRGLGDGVSDFVLEPVKGFQRSVQEMDASYLVDGVARGTLSLARHTVGGFADSAAMLTETFSKNMVVLTLDRRYAQKRDRGDMLRDHGDINVAVGLGSGVQKLVTGFLDGVTGVVKAPIRGAEKKGLEGFAKGIGKGLLGLLVKPIIGISDGISDVFIGVKGTVDGASGIHSQQSQVRPRRALYGRERVLRPYNVADAAAAALMMRTRLAGEPYLSHLDMDDRVALLSAKRLLLLGSEGEELLLVRLKHIESLEVRAMNPGWNIVILLNTPRNNGSEIEVISCEEQEHAENLCSLIEDGVRSLGSDTIGHI